MTIFDELSVHAASCESCKNGQMCSTALALIGKKAKMRIDNAQLELGFFKEKPAADPSLIKLNFGNGKDT